MLKSILGGVAIITILPISLTALSLNYRQESPTSHPLSLTTCLEWPDYDAKAGFPFPFLYGTNWYHTSSAVGPRPAVMGGPFALIPWKEEPYQPDCNRYDMVAFWLDLTLYTGISTIGLFAIKRRQFSKSRSS
jgi:hypothetical protein